MGFSFDEALTTDKDKVRFYTGDRDEKTAMFSDELIAGVITLEGDYQKATVSLMEQILVNIGRQPDLTADWLRINWGGSRETLEKRLADLRSRLGVRSRRTGYSKASYRSDSLQTESPEDW